jgi:hypothetical protein
MEKKAFLVYGKPKKTDNIIKFNRDTNRNLELIGAIADSQGYSFEQTHLEEINNLFTRNNSFDSDFLFYFTGHADKDYLGDKLFLTNDILLKINKFNGKKLIILDACAGDYEGGEDFEALILPKNSKIIGAREIYDNKSLAKLLYDISIYRKIPLEEINKKTFDDIKHNWVYVKERK